MHLPPNLTRFRRVRIQLSTSSPQPVSSHSNKVEIHSITNLLLSRRLPWEHNSKILSSSHSKQLYHSLSLSSNSNLFSVLKIRIRASSLIQHIQHQVRRRTYLHLITHSDRSSNLSLYSDSSQILDLINSLSRMQRLKMHSSNLIKQQYS